MMFHTINKMKWGYVFIMMILLTSCNEDDYKVAIPRNVIGLFVVDMAKAQDDNVISREFANSGIDSASEVFLFETNDRNFGMCARIESSSQFEDWMSRMEKQNECSEIVRRNDIGFATYKDSWILGFNDHCLLALGPVLPNMKTQVKQQMARWLKQKPKQSILESRLYSVVDSMDAPMKMIANISALPESVVAPFTLGLPKNADPSQVYVKAEISVQKDVLHVKGESFSFNKQVDKSLKKMASQFRTVNGRFHYLSPDAFLTLLTNVKGTLFIEALQQNSSLRGVLAGLNSILDLNNVFSSVDGELAISVTSSESSQDLIAEGQQPKINMQAELANTDFLKKEWHQSSSGFHFSTEPTDGQKKAVFYCSNVNTNDKVAADSLRDYSSLIDGERMCLIMQMNAINDEKAKTVQKVLATVFGNINTLFYTIK